MFRKSIDEKHIYKDIDGNEVMDIGESFMDTQNAEVHFYSVYKVPKGMEMRPDKVSISAYGNDEYTEMVCAYNNIRNPFTIEENDIVYMISLNNIYDNTYTPDVETGQKTSRYDILKKYIDKTKLPSTPGSQKSKASIGKGKKFGSNSNSILPPNIAAADVPAYEIIGDRIYFGANNDNYGNNAQGSTAKVVAGILNTTSSSYIDKNGQNKTAKSDSNIDQNGNIVSRNNGNNDKSAVYEDNTLNNILTQTKVSGDSHTKSTGNSLDDALLDTQNNLNETIGYDQKLENIQRVYSKEDIQNIVDGIYTNINMSALSDSNNIQSNAQTILDNLIKASNGSANAINNDVQAMVEDIKRNIAVDNNGTGNISKVSMNAAERESLATISDNDNQNILNDDKNDVTVKTNRLYFDKDNTIGCATDGITVGDFMTSAIKNKVK